MNTTLTSHEARLSIQSDLQRLERLVLDATTSAGMEGVTCDQLETITGLSHQTCSARVNGLAHRSRIVDSGRTRKTRSGRKAIVWIAVTQSPEHLTLS